MSDDNKPVLCKKCGNDKFVIKESLLGGISIGCSECGDGHIFGRGIKARDIFIILKGEDKEDKKV